ncbi:reverse transcriptase domain-containing protein [Tanacetum coccineum]
MWMLYTDGASCSDGLEYEALLAGLRIAADIKIEVFFIFVDSKLVANQVKGLFEARQLMIKQYLEKTKELLRSFNSYTMEHEIADVIKEEGENWMLPIREYLLFGLLPKDPQKARKLRVKAPQYRIIDGNLYRKSYVSSWLRCVGPTQAKCILQEIHKGSCGIHAGSRSVVSKIMKLGYYWTLMHIDAKAEIQRTSTNGSRRFGVSQIIISDNGKQFAKGIFLVFFQRLGIYQSFTSVYDPQANGHVEVTKRDIVKGTYVLRLNSASKVEFQGKMRPTWEGPYIVRKAYGYGAYKMETLSGSSVDRI